MDEIRPEQENPDVLSENGEGISAEKIKEDFEREIKELELADPGFWKESAVTEENAEEAEKEEAEFIARRDQRLQRQKMRRRRRKMLRAGGSIVVVLALLAAGGILFRGQIQKAVTDAGLDRKAETLVAKVTDVFSNIGGKDDKTDGTDGENAGNGEVTPTPQPTATPEPVDEKELNREREVLLQAKLLADQYDYKKAIKLLKNDQAYNENTEMQKAVKEYRKIKKSCVSWPVEEVTHVFYHSLIVDSSKVFDEDYTTDSYNQVMTTVDEFNKITQSMYDKGYVMVSIYDMAKMNKDGVMTPGKILLPPGKIPFVLSQDDLCYYHYMDGDGFATKLIVDEEGKIRNEYVEDDGSVSVGDYDMVPLIDRFVEEHPDFSYRGAKGIVALTGYNGILGYRTDDSYETRPDDLDYNKVEWLDAHPEFSLEKEREGAKKVADAMRAEGWLFASHTWGHKNVAETSMERLQTDTEKFKANVDPLIGGTDIIIFAFGTDLTESEDYYGEKYEYFKGQGYNYFCNVDSRKYFVQIRDEYFRMGRRNLDGYRMYYDPELVEDLFDAGEVFDSVRPVPIPPMG